jgi:hypothetical protein
MYAVASSPTYTEEMTAIISLLLKLNAQKLIPITAPIPEANCPFPLLLSQAPSPNLDTEASFPLSQVPAFPEDACKSTPGQDRIIRPHLEPRPIDPRCPGTFISAPPAIRPLGQSAPSSRRSALPNSAGGFSVGFWLFATGSGGSFAKTPSLWLCLFVCAVLISRAGVIRHRHCSTT